MNLNELDLDSPFLNREERREFRDQVRSVCGLVERYLGKIQTISTWKFLIECVPEKTKGIRDFLGVLTTEQEFDFFAYGKAHDNQKKAMHLVALQAGVISLANHLDLDLSQFKKAFEAVIQKELRNTWLHKEPKFNRRKSTKAAIYCEHELWWFRVFCVFSDIDGVEIKKVKLFETRPNEFAFVSKLGNFKWISSDEISLMSKDKNEEWKAKFSRSK